MKNVMRIPKNAFHFRFFYETPSVTNNLTVDLKEVLFLREFDLEKRSVPVEDFDYTIEASFGGFQVDFFVPNESEILDENFEYLLGEEFEITNIIGKVSNGSTEYNKYKPCNEIGEFIEHAFPIPTDPETEIVMEYLEEAISEDMGIMPEKILDSMFQVIASSSDLKQSIFEIASLH